MADESRRRRNGRRYAEFARGHGTFDRTAARFSASDAPSRFISLVFDSEIKSRQTDDFDGDGRVSRTARMLSSIGFVLTLKDAFHSGASGGNIRRF